MINDTNRDKFEMIKHTQVRAFQRGINYHQINFCVQFSENL